LIANNGIAAVKEIRSVQKWAHKTFGRDQVIDFFVMTTPEDLKGRLMRITFEWPVDMWKYPVALIITTMPTSM
jgi:biotin carboxylase